MMDALLEEIQHSLVGLVGAWRRGDTQRKQELCRSLSDGLYFSRETGFFELRNTWLWATTREFFQSLATRGKQLRR